MAFVKIDTQVLTSTTYADKDAWDVFFAALVIAAQEPPITLREPMPQIEIRSLELTGWSVPVGTYGFARAASLALASTAKVKTERAMAALERLGAPEPESRSQDHEGRRLVRVDGGFIVLNMDRFRQRDRTAAERQRRKRSRAANGEQIAIVTDGHAVTPRDVTQDRRQKTEAEAINKNEESDSADPARKVWAEYNAARATLPGTRLLKFSKLVARSLRARIDEHGEQAAREVLLHYVEEARSSGSAEWCNSTTPLRPENFERTLGRIGQPRAHRSGHYQHTGREEYTGGDVEL